MQPIKLQPVFKSYIWGGEKLSTLYNKKSNLPTIAESWELSTHKDGICLVASGPDAGKPLSTYLDISGKSVISESATEASLPILIKLIDAKSDLSIQVHPDDQFALKNENDFGKTEMWYILDCEEGASIYYGLNKDITLKELEAHIYDNTVTDLLNKVPVKKGDVFFIAPGTIHAIGAGILLAEVQQCSNVTYRVFDYNRVGADGKPRELHIDKTLLVASLKKQEVNARPMEQSRPTAGGSIVKLSGCNYFNAYSLKVDGALHQCAGKNSFHSLLCLEGACTLKAPGFEMTIEKGDSIFIPAAFGEYTLDGTAWVLQSTL